MRIRSAWKVLAAIVAIGALVWWISAQGPGEATSPPAPGAASDARASGPEPSAPPVTPQATVAPDTEALAETPLPSDPMRLEEDLPDSPSGGPLREQEATSTAPSNAAPRLLLPETRPPPDDGRPLRGPEMPIPGLPPAADPTLLPSRPPEDQGTTSTR